MKAITAITATETSRHQTVKRLLTSVIICLTSEIFLTFVATIGCLTGYVGLLLNDDYLVAGGAIGVLIGFTPWSRCWSTRVTHQDNPGLKEW